MHYVFFWSIFVLTVSKETVTLCTYIMSIMFLSKKSNNSDSQVQNTVWFSLQTSIMLYPLLVILIIIFLFFRQKKFCKKKGNRGHQSVCYITWRWGVTCCLRKISTIFCVKKFFFLTQEVMLNFLFDPSHRCALWHEGRNNCIKIFSSMLEITLYFLW